MNHPILYYFIVALHVSVCVILVVVVLLQQGKGDGMGAAFGGGGSQTVFGSRGPTTFFHYLTTGAAGLFIVTSLFLSCTPSTGGGGSVLPNASPSPTPGTAVTTSSG